MVKCFPEHELKVYYPHGGEHFILRWYERSEGNHLIVARSIAHAERAFQSVLHEYWDAAAKEFWKVNIIAPTDAIREQYAKEKLDHEVAVFWSVYSNMARYDYQEEMGSLPPQMKLCPGYKSKYDDDVENTDYHYNCQNCSSKVAPVDGTFEDVYLKHRDKYLAKHPNHQDKRLTDCKALPADPNKTIYTIRPDFGHHHEGIELGEYTLGINAFFFFYQDPTEVDRSVVDTMVAESQKMIEEEEKKRKGKYTSEKKQRKEEEIKELLEFFG